jgi:hypothetical protein
MLASTEYAGSDWMSGPTDWSQETMRLLLAEAVLLVHFTVTAFNAAMLILVPLGARRWQWVRNRRLRLAHLVMMLLIALQTVLGQHCPLTLLEAALRAQQDDGRLFLMRRLGSVLYWDLPLEAFLGAYLMCSLWSLILWTLVPPQCAGHTSSGDLPDADAASEGSSRTLT